MKRIMSLVALAFLAVGCTANTVGSAEDDLGPVSVTTLGNPIGNGEVCKGASGGAWSDVSVGTLRKNAFTARAYPFTLRYSSGETSKATLTLDAFAGNAFCRPQTSGGSSGGMALGPQPAVVELLTNATLKSEDGVVDGTFRVKVTFTEDAGTRPSRFEASADLSALRGTWKPSLTGQPHHQLRIGSVGAAGAVATATSLRNLEMVEIGYINSKADGYAQSGATVAKLDLLEP